MIASISRRRFLAAAAWAAAATRAPRISAAQEATSKAQGPKVCVFSKHLQFLHYGALAKACKELGVDGVDLTVRKGGHVVPARVAEDLPRATEAVRATGLDVSMITTNLLSGADPDARPILEAASKLGIRYARIGNHTYPAEGDPMATLPKVAEDLRSLAALFDEFDMEAGYHNHSGYNNVGAALWDLDWLFREIGSPRLGSNFDAGHTMVEGSFGVWQINTRLIARRAKMMAVKDFVWQGAKPKWVALGQGIVPLAEMLKIQRSAGFAGPISMHFEYEVASNEAMLEEVRAAAVTLRKALKEAGYA